MYRSTPSPRACVRLALVALTFAALTRCAEPPTAFPAATVVPATPRADIGTGPSAPVGEYSWERGQPAVWMGAPAGRACFLTYVGGRFNGVTDWVAVTSNFGGWYLSGASASGGLYAVSARARCFAVTAYSAEKTLTLTPSSPASADAVLLGAGACGLTRVGGKLALRLDGVGISATVSNPVLWINSASESHITASARCVTTPGIVHPVDESWHFPDPSVAVAGLSSVDFCVLGTVEGPFRSADDWVHLSKSTWGWWLGGSGQTYTGGNADCFEA